MNLLPEHIAFIEEKYSAPINSITSIIGWVSTDTSITSKIYSTKEYVETSFIDGVYVHQITSF